MEMWSRWLWSWIVAISVVLHFRARPIIAQGSPDGPCSSLRAAVAQLAARTADGDPIVSYTVFDGLLSVLGFDDDFVLSLNATAVLIPSDAAFADFFLQLPEAAADPLKYVKLNSDVFKQIILFHFSVSDLPGISGTADTALVALPTLHSEGFINADAICGRQNSGEVNIKYSRAGSSITFSETLGQIFNTEATSTICNNAPQAIAYSLSTVLTPCPVSYLFSYPLTGCATIGSVVPEQPFRILAARETGSIVDNFNNPNLLASPSRDDIGYTLFVPTEAALERAGVTNPAFLAVDGALNHVLNGHTVRGKVCLAGPDTGGGGTMRLRTLLSDAFCTPVDTIEVSEGGDGPTSTLVSSPGGSFANTTTRTNLRVCGGVVHEIDDVLLPCSMQEYMSQQRASLAPAPEFPLPATSSAAAFATGVWLHAAGAILAAAGLLSWH